MEYFGHDTNCLTDPNLKKVRSKYKAAGLGIYWHCNEAIALHLDPPNGIDCVLNEDIVDIAHELYESEDFVKEVLEYFVIIGLFTKTDDKKYQNLKLLKRLNRYSRLKLAQLAKKLGLKINMDTMSTQEVLNMLTLGAKDAAPLNLTTPNSTSSNKNKPPEAGGLINVQDEKLAFKTWYGEIFKTNLKADYVESRWDDKEVNNLLSKKSIEYLKQKTVLAFDYRARGYNNLATLGSAINLLNDMTGSGKTRGFKSYSQPKIRQEVKDDVIIDQSHLIKSDV